MRGSDEGEVSFKVFGFHASRKDFHTTYITHTKRQE